MSKQAESKRTVALEDTPILADLDFFSRAQEYHKARRLESKWKAEKDLIGAELKEALVSVKADSAVHAGWTVTKAKDNNDLTKIDKGKLLNAIQVHAKVDAATAAKIIEAGSVPAPRKGSLTVSPPKK